MTVTTAFAAGSAVVVRDEEWIVSSCDRAGEGWRIRCTGSSELVRRSRLWVEAVLRKTPMPLHEPGLTVSQDMLLDPLDDQRQAVATSPAAAPAVRW